MRKACPVQDYLVGRSGVDMLKIWKIKKDYSVWIEGYRWVDGMDRVEYKECSVSKIQGFFF